jgi:fructokinase
MARKDLLKHTNNIHSAGAGADDLDVDVDVDVDEEDGRELIVGVEGGGTSFLVSIAAVMIPHHDVQSASASTNQNNNTTTTKETTTTTTTTVTSINDQARDFGFEMLREQEFPTKDDPNDTLKEIAEYLSTHKPGGKGSTDGCYASLAVVCFGPLGVDPHKPDTYGCILPGSPKANWRNVNVLQPLLVACSCSSSNEERMIPHVVETDVNAPAFAEYTAERKSNQRGSTTCTSSSLSSMAYVTVGTGVGVGLVVNHKTVHGMLHPEGGHVYARSLDEEEEEDVDDDSNKTKIKFPGYSWGDQAPYKGHNTIEGLSCSVSLCERLEHMQQQQQQQTSDTGTSVDAEDTNQITIHSNHNENKHEHNERDILRTLDDTHEIWDHCARGLANLCVTLILVNSIEKIAFGGGIMRRGDVLLQKIRRDTILLLNGYIDTPELQDGMQDFIVATRFGNHAGIIGALMLAKEAASSAAKAKANNAGTSTTPTPTTTIPTAKQISESATTSTTFWNGFAAGCGCGFVALVAAFAMSNNTKRR